MSTAIELKLFIGFFSIFGILLIERPASAFAQGVPRQTVDPPLPVTVGQITSNFKKVLSELAQQLRNSKAEVRRDGAFSIYLMRGFDHYVDVDGFQSALIDLLRDNDDSVRTYAALALSRMSCSVRPRAAEAVAELLADKEIRPRQASALYFMVLGPDGRQAREKLLQSLTDEDKRVRLWSAAAVFRIDPKEKDAGRILRASLSEDYHEICRALNKGLSIELFEEIGFAGVPLLIDGLNDKSSKTRMNSLLHMHNVVFKRSYGPRNLGRPEEKVPSEAIVAVMNALNDRDAEVVRQAICVLGIIGPQAGDSVTSVMNCLTHRDWRVRYTAASVLPNLGPGASIAVPVLKHISEDRGEERYVRIAAQESVQKFKSWEGNQSK